VSSKIKAILHLIRVHQWVKNGVIFMPVFFGGKIFETQLLTNAFLAFIGFSFIASGIYVFNDMQDVAEDRQHPEKKNRPLASGALSLPTAKIILAFLVVLGVVIFGTFFDNYWVWICVILYILQNIFYTTLLKKIALIDVTIISLGFIIRIFLGSVATGVYLSHWIIIMTFLLALFLAFAKRRDDVLLTNTLGVNVRKNIEGYNLEFLNAAIIITAAIVMVAYIMYTTSNEVIVRTGQNIYLTSFFVIIGIFRYLQVIYVQQQSGNPTKVFLKDGFLQIIMVGWILSFGLILYFK
jgi:decaprenyl-phosphate phosphoribosyltransferase